MRYPGTLILPLLLSLLSATESFAAPAPPERDPCKKCVDNCVNEGAREHARCFVKSGELTAAQSYCLRRLLGNFDYPGGQPIDPWTMDHLSGLVESCVALYTTSDQLPAELDLSPERFENCRLLRFYYSEGCAPDGHICRASCPQKKDTNFGTEVDPVIPNVIPPIIPVPIPGGGGDVQLGIPDPRQKTS